MTEADRIARIATILGRVEGNILVGIGDDAAVLAKQDGPLVWTIDEQVQDVHFRRPLLSLEDIGYRATAAAASDLAAMGARALAALASIVAPSGFGDASLDAIARGQRQATDAVGACIVGGNLSRGECLSITTTWLGTTETAILRRGARVGDAVYICGEVGLAAAGFRSLDAGLADAPRAALEAWRRPRVRMTDGLRMASVASASIDVSDGLAKDALHIARASGVTLVLDEVAVRLQLHPATLSVARTLGIDALDLALHGGEDYALLCTSAVPIEGFTRIGYIDAGEAGVVLRSDHGDRPVAGGFDHFP